MKGKVCPVLCDWRRTDVTCVVVRHKRHNFNTTESVTTHLLPNFNSFSRFSLYLDFISEDWLKLFSKIDWIWTVFVFLIYSILLTLCTRVQVDLVIGQSFNYVYGIFNLGNSSSRLLYFIWILTLQNYYLCIGRHKVLYPVFLYIISNIIISIIISVSKQYFRLFTYLYDCCYY